LANPTKPAKPDDNAGFIFRPYITKPDGTVIWAKTYGKKAFKIPVGSDNDNDKKD
jgi:hypothetical protein